MSIAKVDLKHPAQEVQAACARLASAQTRVTSACGEQQRSQPPAERSFFALIIGSIYMILYCFFPPSKNFNVSSI